MSRNVSQIITQLLGYPFDWIPLRSKIPIGKDWPNTDYSNFDFIDWLERGGNIGFRLLPCDLLADADPGNYGPLFGKCIDVVRRNGASLC